MKESLLRNGEQKRSYHLASQDHLLPALLFWSACERWETPWIYIVACDFKRHSWHLNGLAVGASGGGFVVMQGEPRGVGTQLVLFTGPAGYHRSSAPTGLVRDKDSMGKNDRNSGKQQHEGGEACCLELNGDWVIIGGQLTGQNNFYDWCTNNSED